MALAWLAALTAFSFLVLESRGQLNGTVGNPCRPGNLCLDTSNQVCDTNASPPVCRIKAGKNCARQPTLCVTLANCTSDRCVCRTQALDTGLCQKQVAVTTESIPTTAIAATVMTTTTEQSDNNVTVTTTQSPVTTPIIAKPSGAVTWISRGLNHVTQLMAIILLCFLLS